VGVKLKFLAGCPSVDTVSGVMRAGAGLESAHAMLMTACPFSSPSSSSDGATPGRTVRMSSSVMSLVAQALACGSK
jgi:hypothetical protein